MPSDNEMIICDSAYSEGNAGGMGNSQVISGYGVKAISDYHRKKLAAVCPLTAARILIFQEGCTTADVEH